MNIGDLVMSKNSIYCKGGLVGVIINNTGFAHWQYLVLWNNSVRQWVFHCELEVINEDR